MSALSPKAKDPPWMKTMAGRVGLVSPVGW
jgi:hypothetical protein